MGLLKKFNLVGRGKTAVEPFTPSSADLDGAEGEKPRFDEHVCEAATPVGEKPVAASVIDLSCDGEDFDLGAKPLPPTSPPVPKAAPPPDDGALPSADELDVDFTESMVAGVDETAEGDQCEISIEVVPTDEDAMTLQPRVPSPPKVSQRKVFQDSGPLPKATSRRRSGDGGLGNLLVRGRGFKGAPMAPVPLPGALGEDADEFLMDSILEETGVVFQNSGLIRQEESPSAPSVGLGRGVSQNFGGFGILTSEEEDQLDFEEQMLDMDLMELERMDEQQALIRSLQPNGAELDEEVAMLLDSIDRSHCERENSMSALSLHSVQAF